MIESELQHWEARLMAAGLSCALTHEIRRLQALLSPPVTGITAGGSAAPIKIEENAEIGEAWTSEAKS